MNNKSKALNLQKKYFKRQKYPAPWLDRRVLDTGMTKKQILETDFKPEMAINDVWDVIVIGSGTVFI